jgi:Spy/CpxP family protein refolding chaperone
MHVWQSWMLGAVLVGSSLLAWGQQGSAPPPKEIPSPAQQSIGPHRTMEAQVELRGLTQQLGLTPEQREKLRPIIEEEGERLRVNRLDEHLNPDQKRQKALEIRQAYQPKIAALLTPEQQEKFKKMQETYPEKPAEGAKDKSTPPAPPQK